MIDNLMPYLAAEEELQAKQNALLLENPSAVVMRLSAELGELADAVPTLSAELVVKAVAMVNETLISLCRCTGYSWTDGIQGSSLILPLVQQEVAEIGGDQAAIALLDVVEEVDQAIQENDEATTRQQIAFIIATTEAIALTHNVPLLDCLRQTYGLSVPQDEDEEEMLNA